MTLPSDEEMIDAVYETLGETVSYIPGPGASISVEAIPSQSESLIPDEYGSRVRQDQKTFFVRIGDITVPARGHKITHGLTTWTITEWFDRKGLEWEFFVQECS